MQREPVGSWSELNELGGFRLGRKNLVGSRSWQKNRLLLAETGEALRLLAGSRQLKDWTEAAYRLSAGKEGASSALSVCGE